VLTDREWATLFWIAVILFVVLLRPGGRAGLRGIARASFVKPTLIIHGLYFAWIVGVVAVARAVGLSDRKEGSHRFSRSDVASIAYSASGADFSNRRQQRLVGEPPVGIQTPSKRKDLVPVLDDEFGCSSLCSIHRGDRRSCPEFSERLRLLAEEALDRDELTCWVESRVEPHERKPGRFLDVTKRARRRLSQKDRVDGAPGQRYDDPVELRGEAVS